VRRDDAFAGLQFDDDFARHDKVSAEFAKRDALKDDREDHFPRQTQASSSEKDRHRIGIDTFGISPSQGVIRVVERADDVAGDLAVQPYAIKDYFSPLGSCGTPVAPLDCSRPTPVYTTSFSRVSMMSRLRIVS